MARPHPLRSRAELRQCWRQWTKVIEQYASGNGQRQPVDHQEYGRLHTRLLKACRSLAEQADPDQRAYYESLEELAKPWLSPRILSRTDGRFLADVLRLSRQAEEQLTGRERSRRRLKTVAAYLTAAVALVGIVVVLTAVGRPVVDWMRNWPSAIRRAAVATTVAQRLVIGGGIVTGVAIFVVNRMRRL